MRKKERIEMICVKCGNKFEIIPSRIKTAKYCSHKCSNNRIRTNDELNKISLASKEKFVKNPNLKQIVSNNGKKAMQYINENNLNFVMPKGYHTTEHINKMKNIMTGRDVTWGDKIKKNHWSTSNNKNNIVEKINKSKSQSIKWNSEVRKNMLMEWSLSNSDKIGPKMYKKGKYTSSKTGLEEYYQSGMEHRYMKLFDEDATIKNWTKKHNIVINYLYEEKIHKYIPDFLVEYNNNTTELVELKGRIYNQDIIDAKVTASIEYCNKNNLQYKILYK